MEHLNTETRNSFDLENKLGICKLIDVSLQGQRVIHKIFQDRSSTDPGCFLFLS